MENKERTNDLAIRYSFLDTLKYQTELRDLVEKLMEEDRPIRDKPERDKFLALVDRSCFGLDHFVKASFKNRADKGGTVIWNGTLTSLIQTIAYLDEPWKIGDTGGLIATLQFKNAWKKVLFFLATAFALARERATQNSAERETRGDIPGRKTWDPL